MTFLNIGALFGLAAISIPIIIHLLNRFQVKQVTWAAMRFLRESIEKNQRRLQVEDLLLLLLRCLLIALLIFALSRPTWQSGAHAAGTSQVAAVIIIDDSYSMGLTNGITTSFQRAQTAAEQVLAAFPTGSSSALFFAADNVQPVIAATDVRFQPPAPNHPAGQADRPRDRSFQRPAIGRHHAAKARGQRIEGNLPDHRRPGQRLALARPIGKQLADIQKQITVHLVLVGDAAESNLGVTDLRMETGSRPSISRCAATSRSQRQRHRGA